MASDYLQLYGELAANRVSQPAEVAGDILPQAA
jgi:hypothetical protein